MDYNFVKGQFAEAWLEKAIIALFGQSTKPVLKLLYLGDIRKFWLKKAIYFRVYYDSKPPL